MDGLRKLLIHGRWRLFRRDSGGMGFGHADDADLQIELSAGRRERFKADRGGGVRAPRIEP